MQLFLLRRLAHCPPQAQSHSPAPGFIKVAKQKDVQSQETEQVHACPAQLCCRSKSADCTHSSAAPGYCQLLSSLQHAIGMPSGGTRRTFSTDAAGARGSSMYTRLPLLCAGTCGRAHAQTSLLGHDALCSSALVGCPAGASALAPAAGHKKRCECHMRFLRLIQSCWLPCWLLSPPSPQPQLPLPPSARKGCALRTGGFLQSSLS